MLLLDITREEMLAFNVASTLRLVCTRRKECHVCLHYSPGEKTSRASTDSTFLPFMGMHQPSLNSTDKAADNTGSLWPVLLHVGLLDCKTLIKFIYRGRHSKSEC